MDWKEMQQGESERPTNRVNLQKKNERKIAEVSYFRIRALETILGFI